MDFSHIDTENEKVKKIIKSAYEVFALNDLKKASTNMIVKSAGVSRGILYHYFKDKEELFQFMLFHSMKKSMIELDEKIDWRKDDFIRRVCDISKYRTEIIREYPYIIEFAEKYRDRIIESADPDYLTQWREKFYQKGIDYSKFKDASRMKEAIHIIRWTYKGIYMDALKDHKGVLSDEEVSKLLEDCEKYYQILVSLFY